MSAIFIRVTDNEDKHVFVRKADIHAIYTEVFDPHPDYKKTGTAIHVGSMHLFVKETPEEVMRLIGETYKY